MASGHRNRPYSALARFYDQLVGVVPGMNRHARERILGRRLENVRSACDLACGSGETALDLARHGLAVEALDLSPTFCRAVREKARKAGLRIRVRRADMRSFHLSEPVDLLLCEFAALNNLDRHSDLARVLRCAARAVRRGGRFYLDVNTPLAFVTQCGSTEWIDRPDFKLVQRCVSRDGGRRATLTFDWFLPERGWFRHVRETIGHVAWTAEEIRSALRRAGFGKISTFDGADVRPRSMKTRRGTDLYFLAKRIR